MSPSQGPFADSQWVFENQPIVSQNQVAEINLLADKKGPWKREAGSYMYIHL